MFATGIQQAQAGGRHKYRGSGDSVAFEQENKQKAKCLALVISRADACNQEAQNNFNVNVPGEEVTPEPVACAGAAFDARLIDPLTNSRTFPAGSEVCLNNQGENQDVNILSADRNTVLGTVNVVATPSGPDQQCNEPQQSRAEIDSGTVPRQGNFEFGDIICLNLQT
jgi:hypothetical protein